MGKIYLDKLFEFEKFLKNVKRLSKSTIEDYKRDILDFLMYIEKDTDNFTQTDIMRFISSLQRNSYKNSTLNRKLSSIKAYSEYLLNSGKIDKDRSIGIKIDRDERNIPEILNLEEIEKLLKAPNENSDIGTRDKAMIEIICKLGFKVSEITNLNIEDINFKSGYIVKRYRDKEIFVPLSNDLENSIKNYYDYVRYTMNKENTNAFFLNKNGKRISRQGVWKIIKDYGEKVGINKNINPNMLRHSFAVHMLKENTDMNVLKEILGYKNASSTIIYKEKVYRDIIEIINEMNKNYENGVEK